MTMLDIADLYRHDLTLDIAFGAVKEAKSNSLPIERLTRQRAARLMQRRAVVPTMIDRIKSLLGVDAALPTMPCAAIPGELPADCLHRSSILTVRGKAGEEGLSTRAASARAALSTISMLRRPHSGTITVWAVPLSSMQRQVDGLCGMESGLLNVS